MYRYNTVPTNYHSIRLLAEYGYKATPSLVTGSLYNGTSTIADGNK